MGALKNIANTAAAGVVTVGMAFTPLAAANAQSATPVSAPAQQNVCELDFSNKSINVQAGQHSECSRDVAIIVTGHTSNESGDHIGQEIVDAFARRGIPAKYFLRDLPNGDGFAVGFYLNGEGYNDHRIDWKERFLSVTNDYPQVNWAGSGSQPNAG